MHKLFLWLGRICISLIFVASATDKVFNWNETVQYTESALSRWAREATLPDLISQKASLLCSYSLTLLTIATLFEGVGGLFVLLGFRVRLGAWLLILFIIPVTLIMHPFWLMSGQENMVEMTLFMKNLSILGGLMILAAKGGENEAS